MFKENKITPTLNINLFKECAAVAAAAAPAYKFKFIFIKH